MTGIAQAAAVIESTLDNSGVSWERGPGSSYVVTLPGTRKLNTVCNLVLGQHSLRVEAFVLRCPEENREKVWAWLLRRNARMYVVSFAIDRVGDVYLVGRLPLHAVTADEVDRLLGTVLTYADESFNPLLEIGYASAIRREWQWRVARGEPVTNLAAFSHVVAPAQVDLPSGDGRLAGVIADDDGCEGLVTGE